MSATRLVLFVLGVLSLSACNCGGTAVVGGGKCTPEKCASGCCTTDGRCEAGTTDQLCGKGGAACIQCQAGTSCSLGICLTGSGGGVGGNGGGSAGGGSGGGSGGGAAGGAGGGAGGGVPFYDGGCGPIDAGNPPYPRRCAPPTDFECDTATDTALGTLGVSVALRNGTNGNGFDDDCDGLVDEGCPCPGNGLTKDCYLVPATQVNPATSKPVGWCTSNSKGTVDCAGGELTIWSGICRGGQPPAVWDSCAPGDFNCDGLDSNSAVMGCNCPVSVTCPTAPVVFAPYPSPTSLPLIDGSQWITDTSQRASATNWTWTILGGDCDNVLPHPTFALYRQAAASGARAGTRTEVKFSAATNAYVPQAGEPLIAIRAAGYGNGVAGGQIYPAFALSGDYIVQGEFDLGGQHFICSQKVQVRAPGVRAELCWDTVGGSGGSGGNDIDLHFARLQGLTCATKGWDDTCVNTGGGYADCYYRGSSGCRTQSGSGPNWGYADSAQSVCIGWGSKRTTGTQGCTNPRLDVDNITCDRSATDPNSSSFCGPENINLDNPNDNDTFVVGVNHFANHGGTSSAKPHVNLYCNGQRVVSVGYNPATGQTSFPLLTRGGSDSSGDFWTVGTITAHVTNGSLSSCDVVTVPSRHADPSRDGPATPAGAGNNLCVDSTANATPAPNQYNYTSHDWIETAAQGGTIGGVPTTAAMWCKH